MDKKKPLQDDLSGFEEFIQHAEIQHSGDITPGKNAGGESLTFLLNDAARLQKLAQLVASKAPMLRTYKQSEKLLEEQKEINSRLRGEIFKLQQGPSAPLMRSMSAVFDGFFGLKK